MTEPSGIWNGVVYNTEQVYYSYHPSIQAHIRKEKWAVEATELSFKLSDRIELNPLTTK